MPYQLLRSRRPGYFYVTNPETGRVFSNKPLPRSRAAAQMRALYASERYGPLTAARRKALVKRAKMRSMRRSRRR